MHDEALEAKVRFEAAKKSRNIICVTNRTLCKGDFLKRIEETASCGVGAIILREKDLSENEYRKTAEKFIWICRKYNVEAILHTFVDTAVELGVPSLHLSLETFKNLDENKRLLFKKIGVSCHSAADAAEAEKLGAAYITFGHIFATDCKKGLEPRGVDALKNVCDTVKIPVYAIGGISCGNIESVFRSGASGACIMSGFMKCENVKNFMDTMLGEKCDNV